MRNCFHAGDILLPRHISMTKWACVACDQFSSQPEYWDRVAELVGDAPSSLHLIAPEAWLGRDRECAETVHRTMDRYLRENLFETYRRSFVYLERTMADGSPRRGLVGQVDLEDYDFTPGSRSRIRATEGTVADRLPPRMAMLEGARLEIPHVLLLCDDKEDRILTAARSVLGEKLYDFDLMERGGRIRGWRVSGLGVSVVNAAVSGYMEDAAEAQGTELPMAFAVGDGNHSLAAAKAVWERKKRTLPPSAWEEDPARYALVELENIHDPAIRFAPIHRVVAGGGDLMERLRALPAGTGQRVTVLTGAGEENLSLPGSVLPILQPVLDDFVRETGATMDYIHGEDVVRRLARRPDTVGLLLPGMEKADLFPEVLRNGVLPRKAFSMGEAREKRYYLEAKLR